MATASTEIVSKLMEELESISGKENLYGVSEVGTHAGTSQSKRDLSGQGLVMAEKNIREEREIDDDDAVQVVTDQLERRVEEKESGEIVSGKALAVNQRSSSQRQSGKGSKKLIANSRDLVKVMSQQQKGQTNSRKASSRKY
ncbi:hypothetical protein F2Q70_00029462 [Brassica cretica]|nr:hypothetical protein F2Q70_00029462 [Brassica cretica]KAF3597493.1 hypothetical protein DY000_02021141 [Brassica cretica]